MKLRGRSKKKSCLTCSVLGHLGSPASIRCLGRNQTCIGCTRAALDEHTDTHAPRSRRLICLRTVEHAVDIDFFFRVCSHRLPKSLSTKFRSALASSVVHGGPRPMLLKQRLVSCCAPFLSASARLHQRQSSFT